MLYEDNYLAHFGIKGQKWGLRRFQKLDGTLTEEGRARYRQPDAQKELSRAIQKSRTKEQIAALPQAKDTLARIKDSAKALSDAHKEAGKYSNDFYSRKNKEAYDKYTRKYAELSTKIYENSEDEERIQSRLWSIRNDDLDNGESFWLYLQDNPKIKQEYEAAEKRAEKAYKDHQELIRKYAKDWLGDHSSDKIRTGWKDKGYFKSRPVIDRLSGILYNESMKDLDGGSGYFRPMPI